MHSLQEILKAKKEKKPELFGHKKKELYSSF